MAAYKIYTIFMILLLIQAAFAKPVDDDINNSSESSEEEFRKNPTPSQKLYLYTFDNFLTLSEKFAINAANISRYILKDETLVANTKPEVIEFKNNLTMFVEKYETTKNKFLTWDILDIYTNTTDYYLDRPEEKLTTDGKFVLDILNKYNSKDVVANFGKDFVGFLADFQKMFEENKANVSKPLLEWYEKFSSLTDFEEKVDAFSDFIKLA